MAKDNKSDLANYLEKQVKVLFVTLVVLAVELVSVLWRAGCPTALRCAVAGGGPARAGQMEVTLEGNAPSAKAMSAVNAPSAAVLSIAYTPKAASPQS